MRTRFTLRDISSIRPAKISVSLLARWVNEWYSTYFPTSKKITIKKDQCKKMRQTTFNTCREGSVKVVQVFHHPTTNRNQSTVCAKKSL